MKKGDIVQKEYISPQGNVLCRNFNSQEDARLYGKTLADACTVIPDDLNTGKFMLLSQSTQYAKKEGVIHWVIGKEASIVFDDHSYVIVDTEAFETGEWKVIREAAPSFQSQLADMSDEELKASIDSLRNSRMSITQRRSRQLAVTPSEDEEDDTPKDDMSKAIGKLTPEQLAKLMEKLK